MIQEIEIPKEVGVITLKGSVLFPQAMMPLFIFEPRYREMLRDALEQDRIFAVAAADEVAMAKGVEGEPAYEVASIGIVRACKKNEDGTANLILQGLTRVRFESIVTEEPYRRARITQLLSEEDASPENLKSARHTVLDLIKTHRRLGAEIPREVIEFLEAVEGHESMLDLSIYALCSSAKVKQQLLETLSVTERFARFEVFLRQQLDQLKMYKKLKGDLDEEDVGDN